jgi:predicted TIM-barrel enzyme
MNKFETAFKGREHIFLVAIHVSPLQEEVAADIKVAHGEGADGIIVIKNTGSWATDDTVLRAYDSARGTYPKWWIGVNLLDHSALDALTTIRYDTNGLWFDRSHINETLADASFLDSVRQKRDLQRHSTMLLPSVAFKYQKRVHDPGAVAKLAEPYADVIITSGNKTGVPANIEKVNEMRNAVKCPLGLASGISMDNVEQFVDMGVNVFIVNTSISNDKTWNIDSKKVRALRAKIPQ